MLSIRYILEKRYPEFNAADVDSKVWELKTEDLPLLERIRDNNEDGLAETATFLIDFIRRDGGVKYKPVIPQPSDPSTRWKTITELDLEKRIAELEKKFAELDERTRQ